MKIRDIQRVATLGMFTVVVLISACSQEQNSKSTEFAYRERLNDLNISAEAILCEAGRICCEAETFEAEGEMCKKTPEREERIRIRFVFGSRGEYRFDRGDASVIFDGHYLGGHTSGEFRVSYQMKLTPQQINAMKIAIPDLCHPERAWGDMVMAMGMADGMSFPEAMMRLRGGQWVHDFISGDSRTIIREGQDHEQGMPCEKLVSWREGEQSTLSFWIDRNNGAIRKWESLHDDHSMTVTYHRIRINQPLSESEFRFPEEAIRQFEENQKAKAK